MKQHFLAYFLLILTSFLWAANFVSGKFLVIEADVLMITKIRWLIAIITLLPVVYFYDKSLLFPKKAFVSLFLMGLFGVTLFNIFIFLALTYTSASNVGIISTLNPLSIVIFSFIFLKERLLVQQWLGIIISLLGVLVVITNGKIDYFIHWSFNIGDIWMVVAVMIWGLYSVISKRALEYMSAFKATFWSGFFGTVICFVIQPTFPTVTSYTSTFWIAMAYSAIGATVLAMVFWNIGIKRVGGSSSGIFLNLNPIFTSILSFIILNEEITMSKIVGTFIVISGVIYFHYVKYKDQTKKRITQS